MREERKLNKAIKQDGIDTQSNILEDLKRRYPQYVEQSRNKHTLVRKRKFAFVSAIVASAICVAVIVPCAVLLPSNSANSSGNGNIRYCALSEYSKGNVDYTIKEYRENNNLTFMCFDWYEFCEECKTICYTSNSDNEVLCLEEQVYLPQSDEMVQLSITKSNVYLSVFDSTLDGCKSDYTVSNHTVKWSTDAQVATCIFEDGGYRYFIQILQGQDENRLFELVAELLETK